MLTKIPFNFVPLAGPYTVDQMWMARVVQKDLDQGNIAHAAVKERNGTTIYRTAKGWLDNRSSRRDGK